MAGGSESRSVGRDEARAAIAPFCSIGACRKDSWRQPPSTRCASTGGTPPTKSAESDEARHSTGPDLIGRTRPKDELVIPWPRPSDYEKSRFATSSTTR